MNKKLVLALMLAASLAACQKKGDSGPPRPSSEAASTVPTDTKTSAAAPAADAAATTDASKTTSDSQPLTVTAPDLAYSYNYALQAPARDVPSLVRQHEAECSLAGATVCQVVGATTKAIGRDDVSGRLEIRAQPAWITKFRDRIEEDAKTVGGKVTSADTGTDDLSRSLVDTQAAIRAKTDLRDRLEGLLRTHKGRLDDLVSIEQQLAEVQGQIDASQSELAVMRTRVQTSTLVVEYSSLSMLAPDSAFRPLGQATHSFTAHVMMGFAVLLNILSVLLAPGLVVGGAVWFFLRRRKRPVAPAPTAP
jgi:predicted small lipoprotein YifL